jgi:4-amino-4-deoxy-L-arabinose transferase-like glycosyltransferase
MLILAGLTLGYAALTRPFAMLLLPALALVLLWKHPTRSLHRLAVTTLFAITFVLPIAPWTIRNYTIFHKLIPVASNGGSTFYGANNDRVLLEPRHWGGWVSTRYLPHRDYIMAQPDEIAHDAAEWKLGITWCREHWTTLPLLATFKFIRLWLPDMQSANPLYVAIQLVGYTPYFLLYLLGLLTLARHSQLRTPAWLTLHTCILVTVLTALIFWGSPRFRDANTVILMPYAAVGIQAATSWLTQRIRIPRSRDALPLPTITADQ